MDRATQKELYNSCNPLESLEFLDERNVDLDGFGKGEPRGRAWPEKMANEFELSNTPVCTLFSGLPGSGKSTELRRLSHLLDKRGFLPVLIDADEQIDLTSPIDAPEIVAVVVHETERRVLEQEGADPDTALDSGFFREIWDYLTTTEILFKNLRVGTGPVQLTAELKANPTLRRRFREIMAGRLTKFLADARSHMEGLQSRARDIDGLGIVVIFDSLEKLRGGSVNWDAVVDSAERVFMQGAEHVRLPVHTIYTVPTALMSRQRDIEFMPAVKVREQSGGIHRPGVAALRELVRHRIADEHLATLFGNERERVRRIERLIDRSGGYLRNVVHDLRQVVMADEHPVGDDFLDALFQQKISDYRKLVTLADHDWLASIAEEKYLTLPDAGPESRSTAERLLANNVVLRYQNASDWFDLHPAVKRIPRLMERLSGEGKG